MRCNGKDIHHIGGIGIGGGTLSGLSRLLLKTDDVKQITSLALQGHISHINLLIRDISAKALPGLPMDATASLFANAQGNAPREDIAIGLIYMVLQAVGSAAILSANGSGVRDFVLIGNLTLLPQCKYVFPMMEKVYDVHFIIPKYSEFCTLRGRTKFHQQRTASDDDPLAIGLVAASSPQRSCLKEVIDNCGIVFALYKVRKE